MKITSSSRSHSSLKTLSTLLFLAVLNSICAAASPTPAKLAVMHEEFDTFNIVGQGYDYLIWNGTADSWDVFQWVVGGPFNYLGTISGKNALGTSNFVNQFYAVPIAAPTTILHYMVVGHTTVPSASTNSNVASTQELFADPGFEQGPATTGWLQSRTPIVAFPTSTTTNFIQGDPGSFSAAIGGTELTLDDIYTSGPIAVFRPNDDFGSPTSLLTVSGYVSVSTNEDAAETIPYDTLTVQIRDRDTAELLYTAPIADNTSWSKGQFFFNIHPPYAKLAGRNVRVVFEARNDEILSTTFTLQFVQFNLDVSTK